MTNDISVDELFDKFVPLHYIIRIMRASEGKKEYKKAWCRDNKEKIAEYNRVYYGKNVTTTWRLK